MNVKSLRIPIIIFCVFFTFACAYIELPPDLETPEAPVGVESRGWIAVATNVASAENGSLRIDLTLQNETGDWSTMKAAEGKPGTLQYSDGNTAECDTSLVNTGGHRFPPGFQLRGYQTGEMDAPETQMVSVECKDAKASPGAKLLIDYVSYGGILDDYTPDANETDGTMEVDLDKIATDLTYPIATQVEGLIQKPGEGITGLSDNVVTLLNAERTDTGFTFHWQNFNPSKFPLKTHIGTPPVIGADGILYGAYESLDIAPLPITPPKGNMEWTTEVKVPPDGKGFYIILSVESNKPRTYKSYVLDISEK